MIAEPPFHKSETVKSWPDRLLALNVRNTLGLTQDELAFAMGLHVSDVRRWELGTQGMSNGTRSLYRLLAAYPMPTILYLRQFAD